MTTDELNRRIKEISKATEHNPVQPQSIVIWMIVNFEMHKHGAHSIQMHAKELTRRVNRFSDKSYTVKGILIGVKELRERGFIDDHVIIVQ